MLADSHPLGDLLYRKWHMYDMAWGDDKKLENYIVCGATFGGPVAIMKDSKKVPTVKDVKEKILIYTSAGEPLAKIDWDDASLVGMGWSDSEHLVAVTEYGITLCVLVYFLSCCNSRFNVILSVWYFCLLRWSKGF
jgi:vacuolar protein sorting-associated protein 16